MAAVTAVLAGTVATVALGSAAPASAGALERGAGAEVCIERLYVDDTEDFGADGDEPFLKVNTIFWRAPGSMDEPAGAAVNRTVHVGDTLQAYDDDAPDPDDFIGSQVITADRSGTLEFRNDSAHYRADYRAGRC